MEGKQGCGGSSNMSFLVRTEGLSFDVPWNSPSTCAADTFHGKSFEDVGGGDTMEAPISQQLVIEEHFEEEFDMCLQSQGKKRRLTATQVRSLKKSFEAENKLDPAKKVQLAKELGLQPRQVAIWFQNQRARLRNKQLEKDYSCLKDSYDRLKAEYDCLLEENERLKNEVLSLRQKSHKLDQGTERIEPVCATKSRKPEFGDIPSRPAEIFGKHSNLMLLTPKIEETSSIKSDVFDSDSPRNTFLEPANSSYIFEPDQSDHSQDEGDNLSRSFLSPTFFPKHYYHDPSSCNFEFPVEDQPFC